MAALKTLEPGSVLNVKPELVYLKSYINTFINKGISFAIFKLPHLHDAQIFASDESAACVNDFSIKNLGEGFIAAPFYNKNSAYFIRAKFKSSIHIESGKESCADQLSMRFFDNLRKVSAEVSDSAHFPTHALDHTATIKKSNADFQQIVNEAVKAIEQKELDKVVLSRKLTIPFNSHFDLAYIFEKACHDHHEAFVSLFFMPQTGLWLTISPEYLIYADEDEIRTVALAGTQMRSEHQLAEDVLWSQKEIEEQALVSRYIIEAFKKIRLREYKDYGPVTVKAGGLWHLKSEFIIKLQDIDIDDVESGLVQLLHPTAAVCGFPKHTAFEYIMRYEGYDRELYSGFIGPVNFQGQTHVFVNLRCAKIHFTKGTISLYAGAGIVKNSAPEKECLETLNKMRTVGQYFGFRGLL